MNETKHSSLKIDGMGKYPGGEYDEVILSGTAKIDGDIKCNFFNTSGLSTIYGNLDCANFKTSGKSKVEGKIKAEEFELSGMLGCLSHLEAREMNVSGMLTVGGDLKLQNMTINGMVTVKQSIEAESITMTGILECKELLNCEKLEMELNGTSQINEIGAGSICVRPGSDFGGWIVKMFAPRKYKQNQLESNLIEADDIYLENAVVKIVRGNVVKIGPNCKIDNIEYRESLQIDELSTVNSQIHID